jgi:spatacsin
VISAHFDAATALKWETSDLFALKTADFLRSELSMSRDYWPLVRRIIAFNKLPPADVAACLVDSFANCVIGKSISLPQGLDVDDYCDDFSAFLKLCPDPLLLGDKFFAKAKFFKLDQPVQVQVNLLLHSSLCLADVEECAEVLDGLLDSLALESLAGLVLQIVSVFPRPVLLSRFFQFLIAQGKFDALPISKFDEGVGRVIMNCARHVQPFNPDQYFELTSHYRLFRDHAELHMEHAGRFLKATPSRPELEEASKHYLLALAYFLHEKCFSLAMECLKKLSLLSLQLELPDPPVLHLEQSQVLSLMCGKDFPFALTVAVAYGMDKEENWAQAIYQQAIERNRDEFARAFQLFRPVTSSLCNAIVELYKSGDERDEAMKERMVKFLAVVPNLVDRYRIAKDLNFTQEVDSMREMNPIVCEWYEKVIRPTLEARPQM